MNRINKGISDVEQAKQKGGWNAKLNQALVDLATALARNDIPLHGIARIVLDLSRELTGSRNGFVTAIDPESGEILARVHEPADLVPDSSLELRTASGSSARGENSEHRARGLEPDDNSDLAQGFPLAGDEPKSMIRSTNLLAVPLKVGDSLLGRITLWNPQQAFSDREFGAIERIGNLYLLALQRRGVNEEMLRNQRRLEELVAERTAELLAANRSLQSEVVQRRRAEQTLRDLSARLMTAQEQERSWLARELHDDLNQKLALLAVELEQLGQNPPESPSMLRDKTNELRKQTQVIASALHNLSHQLHPSQFKLVGLVPALRRFCREFSQQQGITIVFSLAEGEVPRSIPDDVALCLYRVVQEALQNVAKHSHALEAQVEVSAGTDGVRLCISDSGVGFESETSAERPGLGLVSMRERIKLVGGSMTVESRIAHGTRIQVTVPLPDAVDSGGLSPLPDNATGDSRSRKSRTVHSVTEADDAPSGSTRR